MHVVLQYKLKTNLNVKVSSQNEKHLQRKWITSKHTVIHKYASIYGN